MGKERLWLGGVDVVTWAIKAIDLSGLLSVPEKRGENTPVDGRHGTIHVPFKKYGGRELPMEFWIRGSRADGTVPADPQDEFYRNLHTMGQILSQGVVPLVHQLPDGTLRELPVEVTAAIGPERWKVGDLAKVAVTFTSTEAFWKATTDTVVEFALPNNGTYTLAEFAASDAPVDDLVIEFGPGDGPDLYDTRPGGLWLAYDAVIGPGQSLIVDCGRKKLTGTGGLVPDRTKLRTHPQDGRWFAIDPVPGGAATVLLTHGGGSTPMPVTIAGRQAWMFG